MVFQMSHFKFYCHVISLLTGLIEMYPPEKNVLYVVGTESRDSAKLFYISSYILLCNKNFSFQFHIIHILFLFIFATIRIQLVCLLLKNTFIFLTNCLINASVSVIAFSYFRNQTIKLICNQQQIYSQLFKN